MLCQLLAQAALRHRLDQQGSRHPHQQPLDTEGFFTHHDETKNSGFFNPSQAPFDTRLAFIGRHDLGIAQLAGADIRAEPKAGLALLLASQGLVLRPDVRVDLPLDSLQGCLRRRAAFASIAFMFRQATRVNLVVFPALC